MIRPNKKYAFDAPSVNLEKRSLVRTGTYPDGNCFIHALLRAIDSSYRKQDSQAMHVSLVGEFRKKIYEWLTPDLFYSFGSGEQVKIYFYSELSKILDEKYSESESQKEDDMSSVFQIIRQLIPRKFIDEEILPKISDATQFYAEFLSMADRKIKDQLRNYDIEKTQAICNLMSKYFIDIFQEAHERAFQNFRTKLRLMNEYVDSFQMECISKFVKYNFLFIDGKTLEAYQGLQHIVSFDKTLDCVLFLWVNDNHFEVLGVLEHGNIINRIFKSDDPLIQRLLQSKTN